MIRRRYGAPSWHLLGHLALFGIVVYAVAQVVGARGWVNFLAWLLAGALLHDLVLLPAYSLADAGLRRAFGRRVNHVRVPLVLAGLLALMFFPLILREGDGNFVRNAGHHAGGYARSWGLLVAGLLIVGAAAAVRRRRGP